MAVAHAAASTACVASDSCFGRIIEAIGVSQDALYGSRPGLGPAAVPPARLIANLHARARKLGQLPLPALHMESRDLVLRVLRGNEQGVMSSEESLKILSEAISALRKGGRAIEDAAREVHLAREVFAGKDDVRAFARLLREIKRIQTEVSPALRREHLMRELERARSGREKELLRQALEPSGSGRPNRKEWKPGGLY